jgi:hypothetical protein
MHSDQNEGKGGRVAASLRLLPYAIHCGPKVREIKSAQIERSLVEDLSGPRVVFGILLTVGLPCLPTSSDDRITFL